MIESKESLKAFFAANKAPTQENFWKLIDAFVHRDEQEVIDPEKLIQGLSEETILALANRIESSRKPMIRYRLIDIDQAEFEMSILSLDDSEQLLTATGSTPFETEDDQSHQKLYLLNQPPYQLKLNSIPADHLLTNEYLLLTIDFGKDRGKYSRLLGHDLPYPKSEAIGAFDLKNGAMLQLRKLQTDSSIGTKTLNVQFLNNTSTSIRYALSSDHIGHLFQKEDCAFMVYDIDDMLYFNYNADMTNETKKIECKLFNANTEELLATAFLNPTKHNQMIWGGGAISADANSDFRIECEYQ